MASYFAQQWEQCLAGDAAALARWQKLDGSEWDWQREGVRVKGTGSEWIALAWQGWEEMARSFFRQN